MQEAGRAWPVQGVAGRVAEWVLPSGSYALGNVAGVLHAGTGGVEDTGRGKPALAKGAGRRETRRKRQSVGSPGRS